MRVTCRLTEIDLDNDEGEPVDSIRAVCTRCDSSTESFGTSDRSIRRCLVLLRSGCPRAESNFYVAANEYEPTDLEMAK